MKDAIFLQELEAVAEELGIEVQYDDFEGKGGLCRYNGKSRLIVNRFLSERERIALIAGVLARQPLGGIFIRPQVRELLEACAPESFSNV